MLTDPGRMLLSPGDTVYVLRDRLAAGEAVMVEGVAVAFAQTPGLGHKIARLPVAAGDTVIEYGAPIGRAVASGDHVHSHNLVSDFTPTYALSGGN